MSSEHDFSQWMIRLRAIAQTGLAYTKDPYDVERYRALVTLVNEMHSGWTGEPVSRFERLFLPDKGYATPKVDLRAGVIRNGRMLLVRERDVGRWSLPGGWADPLESPTRGIIREVFEESGFRVSRPRLVAVVDRGAHEYTPPYPWHVYKLFFLCQLDDGEARTSVETDAVGFFGRAEIPDLATDRVLLNDVHRLFDAGEGRVADVYVD